MKNLKDCDYCFDPLDISKESYIHSPKMGTYHHADCFLQHYGKAIREGVMEVLRDEKLLNRNKQKKNPMFLIH